MGQAVRSSTGEDDVPATSQLTVTYLRPGRPGTVVVTATVRTQGEHLTVCEADVEQEGRALVHAVATFALLHHGN
jgi:acyl-coenzyme A thioesterase PaaI-like protein